MARTELTITLGELDDSKSVNVAEVTPTNITADGVKLKDAAGAKYESIWLVVAGASAGDVTIKAGDAYPNNLLGDCTFEAAAGVAPFQIADYARFLNKDGSIDIDFESGFSGTIYAIGQRAGIKTVEA
jgi:hypothetical protein